jgi:hypothetical protein
MTKRKDKPPVETFAVRFTFWSYGKVIERELRVARPVTDAAILKAALAWRRANPGTLPRGMAICETSDYGGVLISRGTQIGRYLIVPGSSRIEKVA